MFLGSIRLQPLNKTQRWLNPLLIVGVLVYLFSPLLDHWLGHGGSARPHNHLIVAEISLLEFAQPGHEQLMHSVADDNHDEGVLCLLDFNLLFAAILLVTIALGQLALPRFPLSFALLLPGLAVTNVALPGHYPPPRF